MAGAAFRVELQLFCGSSDEVCRGILHHDGRLHPARDADAAAVGGAGGGGPSRAGCAGGWGGGGAMSGGSAEQALLTAGCAQMHRFYDLPGGAASGISDSKLPDMQAGWEQGITNSLAGLAGLNMCYEAVGMHASLLGFCLESLVLGDDLLGQAMRLVRGIDVTPDSTSIEAMKEVCLGGPGHYLGSDQTLKLMQTEYIYPAVGNRMSPKEWNEAGKPLLLDTAIARKNAILAKAGNVIDPQIDAAIRAKYNIYFK